MNLRDAVSVDRPGFRARLTQQIEYSSVGRSFDDPQGLVPAVVDADLTIDRGEFNCFIGPSGCGMCTLLNMAARLLSPGHALHIRYGRPRHQYRHGILSRRRTPCSLRTVESNVAPPLELPGPKEPFTTTNAGWDATLPLVQLPGRTPSRRARAGSYRNTFADKVK